MSCYYCGDYPDRQVIDANGEGRQMCQSCIDEKIPESATAPSRTEMEDS